MMCIFCTILQEVCQTWKQWPESRRGKFLSNWLAFQWRWDWHSVNKMYKLLCSLKFTAAAAAAPPPTTDRSGKWGGEIKSKIPSASGLWLYVVGTVILGLHHGDVSLPMLRYLDGLMLQRCHSNHACFLRPASCLLKTHSGDVKQHRFCAPCICSRGGGRGLFSASLPREILRHSCVGMVAVWACPWWAQLPSLPAQWCLLGCPAGTW